MTAADARERKVRRQAAALGLTMRRNGKSYHLRSVGGEVVACGGLPVIDEYVRHRQRDGRGSAAVRLSAAWDELICDWITHLAAAGHLWSIPVVPA